MPLNWDNIRLVSNILQDSLATESVTILHYSNAYEIPDLPFQEETAEPSPTSITIKAQVREVPMGITLQPWGQIIDANYLIVVTSQILIDAGIDILDPIIQSKMTRDRVMVRGFPCSIIQPIKQTSITTEGDALFTSILLKKIER